MTTTTHFTAMLAEDRRRRLHDDAAARRLARAARAPTDRAGFPSRPTLLGPRNTLQTCPA
jgi:hypothetical protein